MTLDYTKVSDNELYGWLELLALAPRTPEIIAQQRNIGAEAERRRTLDITVAGSPSQEGGRHYAAECAHAAVPA